MSVIYIALPVAVILAGAAVVAFIWCARRGQLDDLDGPPMRMVHDDEE
ncbi:cbb3-type cytochrome oxidase assembly protein CcoS [Synechococcus sp. Cruz CV-v-12]|nr:cbb3-type cytochrome oxidase assembly protein CcoS [Synechococcus sp. Cruz CV-v-12]MCP9874713.1 cbb3-type cytochrome oxidase assembly protein CcoS [Synechococcus sp. Cruz CV-v-12]